MKLNIKKLSIILAITALFSLTLAAIIVFMDEEFGLEAVEYNIDESQTFSAGNLDSIRIETSSADVKLMPSDSENVEIRLYGKVKTTTQTKPKLEVVEDDGELTIKIDRKEDSFVFFDINLMSDLNLEIKVPDNKKQILIDGSSGDIDINDLKAVELDIDLSSGSISLEKIMTDEFSYSISSGNIDIEEMTTGKLQGQASSGRIDASSLISGSTEIESLSGKIMLDFKELNGDVRLSASSGRIELRLPKDSDFSYDLVASSGDIRNTFSGSNIDADNYLSGTVKTGKYKIDVRTSSGDITIS